MSAVSSPMSSPRQQEKHRVTIAYENYDSDQDTPHKQYTEQQMPSYAMLHAKKAINFGGELSRENSSDSLIEQKYQKDLYFPVDNNVKFDDLFDWNNSQKQLLTTSVGEKTKTGTLVTCNKQKIALFRYGSEVFAIDEKCPHLGGPLHLGDIENVGQASILCVVCPWHKWRIELSSGRLKVPRDRGVRNIVYPTKVNEDGTIMIGFDQISKDLFDGDLDF